ncbi:unnamed protein product [Alternaria alternata]
MVAKSKRNAAHDKRHENGLAAPGRKITKQKSNPQLNGHANGKTHEPTPPVPSHVDTPEMTQPASAHDPVPGSSAHVNTTMAAAPSARRGERTRAASDASLDNPVEACRSYDNGSNGPFDPMPSALRRADTNTSKTASMSMASMLSVPATILTSCPLRDVLAILIILLQLPPTVLTVVQFFQQPFWAALASTKVTVLKEMESSRAANDADEANAKDANHIGNAVWRSEDDRVWISEVGFSDISFRVSLSGGAGLQEQDEEDSSVGSGIDKSKPFYIRVNGADWSSTRIRQSEPIGFQGQEGTGYWVGEIFGLTALSNYYCEFVRTNDNEVFYSASLITSASPVTELASASIASPPAHQTLRPSSPTTTLKNSIAAADQQLQEQRNRLKRNKKDHKTAITNIKKEVDTLGNRLANAGGSDERQRQRVLQFTQNIRQAEDAAAEFAVQAENLGSIPEDEAKEAAAKKAEWKKERNNKNTVASEFDKTKEEIERQVQSVESDISTAFQKRERLQQRQTRLNEQHDRLVTANAEGFTAKQRREQERTALRAQRAEVEHQYRSNINGYERRTEEQNVATSQILVTVQQYEELLLQQAHQHMSVPTTPEGNLPGTTMSPYSNGLSNFTFPSMHSHMNGTPGSMRGGRGRSSSMLSNVSGFTDAFDEPTASGTYILGNPFSTPGPVNGRNRSHGSGSLSSGTSSQSSSQRDPLSPVQSIKPMMVRSPTSGSGNGLMSPIGTGR